jgi:hypothetical protein
VAELVKLIAVLNWYDERTSWLAGCVASLKKADVSHVIAVDGAYCLYPNGKSYSGPEQHAVIVETCRALEMGCTIHTPQEPWIGNEVEKRTVSLKLAETIAVPYEDWYLIHDADHVVNTALGHTKRLQETDRDVAEVRFVEKYDALLSGGPLRCIFRAIPGTFYDGNHYTPRAEGADLHLPSTPALDLSCIEIEHRTRERDRYRKEAQQSYYDRRDRMGAEVHPEACAA